MTVKLLDYYKEEDPKIKIHRLPYNRGGVYAKNYGVRHAKGDFVAIWDDDDLAYSYRLKRSVEFLLDHPEVDVVGSHLDRVD